MIFNLVFRHLNNTKYGRRAFSKKQWQHIIQKSKSGRKFSSHFQSSYVEHEVLRKRLEEIPVSYLLQKEIDHVQQLLCFENDERLLDVFKRSSKVFNYNAKNGKMIHAAALLKAYCVYSFNIGDSSWSQWDSDGWRSASLLAWCLEILKSSFLMIDDILDHSVCRRGQPCWYTKEEVGLMAVNDSLLLQYGIFKVLPMFLVRSNCFVSVLQEILKINHETVCGQCLDMMTTSKNKKKGFENFTLGRYQIIAEYKTAMLLYCLPVHLGMRLAGDCSEKELDITRNICLKLGLYFQCQDDFLDAFGEKEITGKYGSDISEGKCTWLAAKFLEEASEPMKKTFLEHYGIDDETSVAKIVDLYRKIKLQEKFMEFDKQIREEIKKLIESLNRGRGYLFLDLLSQLGNRQK